MRTSEQIDLIAAALAKAQGELEPATKDSTNPAYRSKYADRASCWAAWRKVGPPNGLALIQESVRTEQGVATTSRLLHTSGQWIEFEPLEIPLAKQDAHGVGSAASYGERYGMNGACGVVGEEDDDGNAAVNSGVRTFPEPQAVKPYYRRQPPASIPGGLSTDKAVIDAEEEQIFGKKDGGAPPPEPGLMDQLPEGFRKDRYALEGAVARLMQNRGVTSEDEKLALSMLFLKTKPVPDAAPIDLAKLYVFLNDPAGVADWRKEQARRAKA